jgi:hypothetical protein
MKLHQKNKLIGIKLFPVLLMNLCLVVLTASNFFIYPDIKFTTNTVFSSEEVSDKTTPQIPAEEKSSENSISVHEDFLPEDTSTLSLIAATSLLPNIINADKLQIIPYDLISPPPKCRL